MSASEKTEKKVKLIFWSLISFGNCEEKIARMYLAIFWLDFWSICQRLFILVSAIRRGSGKGDTASLNTVFLLPRMLD